MRKLIIIVVSMLVPFGLWTAGCRQERDTAFPNSPEMKNLARAPERNNPTRPPVIPAAPIDRDILQLPEHNAMARVDAVNDRSNAYAGSNVNPGLFVLPEERGHMAALPAEPGVWEPYEDRSAVAMTPIPSAREFWSKPAAPLPNRAVDVPSDVSAMMPAAPVNQYPASSPSMLPAPYSVPAPMPYSAPYESPVSVPFPEPYASPAPAGPSMVLPNDIPGVYMDTGDYIGGAPTQPPTQSGWIGMRDDQGDALGAPPLLSSAAFESVPADQLVTMLREDKETENAAGPIKLDLDSLLSSMRTIADTMIPAQETPAAAFVEPAAVAEVGEWKSMDMWSSAMPVPAAAPEQPMVASPRSLGSMDELREALAPLPDITAIASSQSRGKMDDARSAPITMPAPMPEPEQTPEMAAAKSALLDYQPDPSEKNNGFSEFKEPVNKDFFRNDFWENKPGSPIAGARDFEPQPMKIPESKASGTAAADPMRIEDLPPLSAPAIEVPELVFDAKTAPTPKKAKARKSAPEQPQKVKLMPMRHSRLKANSEIDATVEVPPLKF